MMRSASLESTPVSCFLRLLWFDTFCWYSYSVTAAACSGGATTATDPAPRAIAAASAKAVNVPPRFAIFTIVVALPLMPYLNVL